MSGRGGRHGGRRFVVRAREQRVLVGRQARRRRRSGTTRRRSTGRLRAGVGDRDRLHADVVRAGRSSGVEPGEFRRGGSTGAAGGLGGDGGCSSRVRGWRGTGRRLRDRAGAPVSTVVAAGAGDRPGAPVAVSNRCSRRSRSRRRRSWRRGAARSTVRRTRCWRVGEVIAAHCGRSIARRQTRGPPLCASERFDRTQRERGDRADDEHGGPDRGRVEPVLVAARGQHAEPDRRKQHRCQLPLADAESHRRWRGRRSTTASRSRSRPTSSSASSQRRCAGR